MQPHVTFRTAITDVHVIVNHNYPFSLESFGTVERACTLVSQLAVASFAGYCVASRRCHGLDKITPTGRTTDA